ncbi:hypothetical protein D046_3345B, partial [Vibrio parahaemolyticus V-223/04]
SSITLHG